MNRSATTSEEAKDESEVEKLRARVAELETNSAQRRKA